MRRLLVLTLLCILSACLKPSDSDMAVSHSQPFQNGNLSNALSKNTSTKLFYQAFVRLQLAALLDTTKGYTIFAPVDSAMIAAGLNESTINSLSVDSLRKLITPHFAGGALDEFSFTNSLLSLKTMTFRQDTSFSQSTGHTVYTYPLYAQEEGDHINFNGFPVAKAGPVIAASNGYIYPITHVLYGVANQSLRDVITSQADLSLFAAALAIGDSIRWDALMKQYGAYDTTTNDLSWLGNIFRGGYVGYQPTILAPTNTAFNKAGFYTVDDIRQYALSVPTGWDPNGSYVFNYSPLDSMLKKHFIYNFELGYLNKTTSTVILYSDFLHPQTVNNGVYNIYKGRQSSDLAQEVAINYLKGLQFSAQQGVAYVKWNDQLPAVVIQRDEDPTHSVRNFVTTFGALYKIDELFYPNN